MEDFLICTVVGGRYKSYIDMWHLALEYAYPEYKRYIKVVNNDKPTYYAACYRYLFDYPEAKTHYITDIDMMIVREEPTLYEYHNKEILETGLCYSNTFRGKEVQGFNRLTGLHFVTNDWWEKTAEARDVYTSRLNHCKIGNEAIDDELMLMDIVKDSGLPMPPPKYNNLIERHHGLHLGTVRAHKQRSQNYLKSAVYIRVNKDKAAKWQNVVCSNEYGRILHRIKAADRQAYEEFMIMDKYTKQRCNER